MIEVESHAFSIKLAININNQYRTQGNYVILLMGKGNGNIRQSFYDVLKVNSEFTPFSTIADIVPYAEEMASFWQVQSILNNNAGDINIVELSIIWQRFALAVNSFLEDYGELDLVHYADIQQKELPTVKIEYFV